MKKIRYYSIFNLFILLLTFHQIEAKSKRPNILVVWGDDIGFSNVSAYNLGMMGYQTPNIDRVAHEGGLFTHYYSQQSCTAGRASFILGEEPFRTGLLTIGLPGSPHGIPEWAPTIADLLKNQGYTTGQFGKNHLGDRDEHLPTEHGFDEFFGNLYHLNAEEEPESYYYPKDEEFKKKYGPRGVIHSYADGRVSDTGPLTKKRMETIDDELLQGATDFIERAHKADKPFFLWFNSTRMHIWTHLKNESEGKTGVGEYADGMIEHDRHLGVLLNKLEELGIDDNTIVIWSTDNGTQKFTWPDGGVSPFKGDKGTTWEGGFRAPCVIKWPGVIKPGTKYDGMASHMDWMPTLLSAAGVPDVKERLKEGYKANGKTFRVHLDGYDLTDYLAGNSKESPRETFYYFSSTGDLNAVRWKEWKVSFAVQEGDMSEAYRAVPAFPKVVNLKLDPFETAQDQSKTAFKWYVENMWLFGSIGEQITKFVTTVPEYPFQPAAPRADNINYEYFKKMESMQQLKALDDEVQKLNSK
ncbi:arylsulfatase [Flammeovirga sp. SubArs3]|uniref:arylsulfatase n=1 Tax=Flammeovirga sp. SubArs3 TaxID=2995316 RepID=UPI00248B9FB2|nr:arylsulfatase [Flammeovirga sp. SubArs3]